MSRYVLSGGTVCKINSIALSGDIICELNDTLKSSHNAVDEPLIAISP